MSTLYYTKDKTGNLFALAGDGAGSAAWLETRDQNLANDLAEQHGNAAFLTEASFASWKQRYLSAGLAAAEATDDGSLVAAIRALPDAIAKSIKSLIFR